MKIRLPRRPPKNSAFGIWANDIMDVIERIVPQSSPHELLSRTTRGTYLVPEPSLGGGKAAEAEVPTQWVDKAYSKGDLVICETKAELDDGNQAGTYYATADIKQGDPRPGAAGSKWADFALGRWQKLTFRVGNSRITVDAGREGGLAAIRIERDYTAGRGPLGAPTSNSIVIDLADIPANIGPQEVKLRESFACDPVTAQTLRCLVLRSDFYA